MKPIVELISAWDEYASKSNQECSVKDFCAYYLDSYQAQHQTVAQAVDNNLAKIIGRLASINKTYLKLAFREIPDAEIEWYFLLGRIKQAGEIRKTDVISLNLLLEPTTCIDITNRMIKVGLVTEKTDKLDKRVRLLTISPKGEQLLAEMELLANKTNSMLFGGLAVEDKEKIISTLQIAERYHVEQLLNITQKDRLKNI
ncbi:MarR family winged helix-turn-helix transcriptional regulator [Mucilaginibacter sp. X4EP1]|uniref:MarR family winged helix-turn-helix transcriptional regulator n=1 Tax=Mucilaginibacter sp. X4EP1 TaxID=2723092 RepID=UPI0021670C0B|nr:MarR family winged helix-turn-helix transcriptional regulator [Mucilaginibacter sp. X4EP1]MCS3814376.1 DNA-binding MarR family transcriptional regulator [Mucilaginibacter sp. X4EP1]